MLAEIVVAVGSGGGGGSGAAFVTSKFMATLITIVAGIVKILLKNSACAFRSYVNIADEEINIAVVPIKERLLFGANNSSRIGSPES